MRLRDGDTGPEVARRLSARGVSIVITTAHVEDAMKLEGVLGIVPKPCSSQTIRAVLRYAAQRLEGTEAPPPPGVQKYEVGWNRISMGRLTRIAKMFGV